MNKTCVWKQEDNDYALWATDCEHVYEFYSDGPSNNGFAYCPYCGRKLVEQSDE